MCIFVFSVAHHFLHAYLIYTSNTLYTKSGFLQMSSKISYLHTKQSHLSLPFPINLVLAKYSQFSTILHNDPNLKDILPQWAKIKICLQCSVFFEDSILKWDSMQGNIHTREVAIPFAQVSINYNISCWTKMLTFLNN